MGDYAAGLGLELYERTGLDPELLPRRRTIEIALRLYGDDCIVLQPRAKAEATTAVVAGSQRIVLRRGTLPARANWLVAKMLMRLELARFGVRSEELEADGAAWLVAPTEAFRAHLESIGWAVGAGELERLSAMFAVPCTCAALRIPEVGGPAVAVVTPERVYKRGQQLSWLEDGAVRSLAATAHPKSVRKVAIRDEPGRVALLARCA
jgi:hypothetical protein